ncbi:hypothetical protein ACHAWO_007966 [Cyclotella atomus]|uniref:Uncharacterized protein n=1 Tax=Cyclotella atomus TaxID=382360 RepID=A0ABD3MZG8_9STRA
MATTRTGTSTSRQGVMKSNHWSDDEFHQSGSRLLYLHTHLSEQQMGGSISEDKVHNGFPYVKGDDGTRSKIDCSVATLYLTAHFSHRDLHMAMEELHIYPTRLKVCLLTSMQKGEPMLPML